MTLTERCRKKETQNKTGTRKRQDKQTLRERARNTRKVACTSISDCTIFSSFSRSRYSVDTFSACTSSSTLARRPCSDSAAVTKRVSSWIFSSADNSLSSPLLKTRHIDKIWTREKWQQTTPRRSLTNRLTPPASSTATHVSLVLGSTPEPEKTVCVLRYGRNCFVVTNNCGGTASVPAPAPDALPRELDPSGCFTP